MKIQVTILLLMSMSITSMEAPPGYTGKKRPAKEIEGQEIEPIAKEERVETPEEKQQRIQARVKELEEAAKMQNLPEQLFLAILEQLKIVKGFGPYKLHVAAANIRNFLLSTKLGQPYLRDFGFNTRLIKELADRYTNGDELEAAMALGTVGASLWIKTHLKFSVLGQPNRFSWHAQQVALRAIAAMKMKQNDLAGFLLKSAASEPDVPQNLIPNNVMDAEGDTLLIAAAKSGNAVNLKRVLALKPDINFKQRGRPNGHPALFYAINAGCVDCVRELINAGAQTIWRNAATNVIENTALLQAVEKNNPAIVAVLITVPAIIADINFQDSSDMAALQHAIAQGNDSIVRQLLQVPGINKNGDPLFEAIALQAPIDIPILTLLIQSGANPDIPTGHYFPIIAAMDDDKSDAESAAILAVLLEKADPNKRDKRGKSEGLTALMMAASQGKIKSVEVLLKYYADPNLKDDSGHTALWYAQQSTNKNKDVIIRMLRHIAGGQE